MTHSTSNYTLNELPYELKETCLRMLKAVMLTMTAFWEQFTEDPCDGELYKEHK